MLVGFGSFGNEPGTEGQDDASRACLSAGNIWTGEQPNPCKSPESVLYGQAAMYKAAYAAGRKNPKLLCDAIGGKYTWYGICECTGVKPDCEKHIKASEINTFFGMPKLLAYGVIGSVGIVAGYAAIKTVLGRKA